MSTYVIDIETDGLVSTKIHVMSVGWKVDGEWKIKSTNDPSDMEAVMTDPRNIVIGHFFKMFDAVELERVLGFKVEATIIDTLPLAWYIFPNRTKSFGLGAFGEDYGVPKPKIDDWEGLTYEDYKHRCEEDVKINILLWEDISERLIELYGGRKEAMEFIKYLMFKMDCLVEHQRIKTLVDVDKVKENIGILTPMLEDREAVLIAAMPPGKLVKTKPKKMRKADGTLSALGERWYSYLKELGLPITTEEVRDPANPSSTGQLKDWLFSLGWEPEIFNDGANGPVPQIRNKDKELCDSILKLAEKEPAIEALDGITVIGHRLAVLNGFLDCVDKDNYTIARASGFTNTLRLKHSKPIVNLPGVTGDIHKAMEEDGLTKEEAVALNLRDGQIIRECIIAPEGYELCGSDISSLEDNTKRHYMFDYDPEYVEEQMEEGFDPHLDLAFRSGVITQEDLDLYRAGDKETKARLKPIRDVYKVANYSCIYGVGGAKLGKTVGISTREAKKVIASYWDRNWSIKQLPNDIVTKVVDGQDWLQNPVNKFWYSYRSEKDIFSTLNQGTGAFVFDVWLKYMMSEGVTPFLQYHDEMLALSKIGSSKETKRIVEESMEKVNRLLKLNVVIGVDVQFGETYADVH